MSDQSRTLTEMQRRLADNNTEKISAQDLRDAIESIRQPVVPDGIFTAGVATKIETYTPVPVPNGPGATTLQFTGLMGSTYGPTVVPDVYGMFDPATPERLTAPVGGWYFCSTFVDWKTTSDSLMRLVAITTNTPYGDVSDIRTPVQLHAYQTPSGIFYLAAGEYAKVYVAQQSGEPSSTDYAEFAMALIGQG